MLNLYRFLVLVPLALVTAFNSFSQEVYETANCEFTGINQQMRFLWIPGLPGPGNIKYNSTETSIQFEEFSDGTAHVFGHVHNQTHSQYGWDVDIWFKEKTDWNEWSLLGRGWKGEIDLVGDLYETWDYYILDDSKTNTLTGTGPYAGSVLELFHSPSSYYYGLQVGLAANALNAEPGLSCWMHYNGQVNGIEVCGDCDINGEGGCEDFSFSDCPENSELLCGDNLENELSQIPSANCPDCELSIEQEIISECPLNIAQSWTLLLNGEVIEECSRSISSEYGILSYSGISSLADCEGVEISTTSEEINGELTSECGAFRTQTPGGWGSPANGNNPGAYRDANFDQAFPNGLTIGCNQTLTLNSAQAVEAFLPSAGSPSVLEGNLVNPTGYGNTLAGQLVALALTLGFDEEMADFATPEGTLHSQLLTEGPFQGFTVDQVFQIANQVLGGCNVSYSPSQVTDALSTINQNYVDGTTDLGNLFCVNATSDCQTITINQTTYESCFNTLEINQIETSSDYSILECPESTTVSCDVNLNTLEFPLPDDLCEEPSQILFEDEVTEELCGNSFTMLRTWMVYSGEEVAFTCTQTITVTDNEAPTFINPPEDLVLECGGIPQAEIQATDNCSNSEVSIEITEYELSGTCHPTIYRVFMAEDACGNVTTHSQYITVVDTTAPVLVSEPEDLALQCGEELPPYTPEATDNCDNDLIIEEFSNEVATNCGYRVEQVWLISDVCGNSVTTNRVVTFEDQTPPVLVSDVSSITIECGEELPEVNFEDDCGEVTVDVAIGNAVICSAVQLVYYTATDNCGNQITVQREVEITDSSAPVISGESAVNLICGQEISEPEVTDCNEFTLSSTDSGDALTCGEFTRTWTATDVCGNSSEFVQTITFSNEEPPVLSGDFSEQNISCSELESIAQPSATDSCGENLEVTFEDSFAPAECGYSIIRTWTAADACGNVTTQNQTINVTDQSAPVITGPDKLTAQCGEELEQLVTVEDDCSEFVQLEFNDVFFSEQDCEYAVERTYTATDVCGNSSSFTQYIAFSDTEGPVISGAESVAISCLSELENVPTAEATDNCGNVNLTFADELTGEGCSQSVFRTYTATDDCGNESSLIQLIEIVDEVPPVFDSEVSDVQIFCGEAFPEPLTLTASDNCSQTEVNLEETTAEGSCGIPALLRTWTATDACGNTTQVSQFIDVIDNTPPTFITEVEDVTLACGADVPVSDVQATDECSAVTIAFTEESSPNGCPNIIRTWTATDACGNSAALIQNITIEDNEAPLVTGILPYIEADCASTPDVPIPDVSDNCDDEVNITLTEAFSSNGCETVVTRQWIASDNCGNTTVISQTLVLTDNEPPVFVNPIGVNAVECQDLDNLELPQVTDDCAGEVNLTYSDEQISTGCNSELLRTYVATDLCGNTATFSQTIFLIDMSPPLFTGVPLSTFVDCGSIPEAQHPVATDDCSETAPAVEFNEVILNEGGCSFTVQRTWQATDDCGNSSLVSQFIFVSDTQAPVFEQVPQDLVLGCTAQIPAEGEVVVTDNCDENLVITLEENTVETVCGFLLKRTWTATDLCGNESDYEQTIEFTDLEAPVVLNPPSDMEVSCSDIPAASMLSASDECDDSPLVVFSEQIIEGNCPYEIIRTWRAVDDCGNESEAIQTITVIDNEAPEFNAVPLDLETHCNAISDAETLTATDNCSQNVTIDFSEELVGELCNRSLLRTWTATDLCGNTKTHVQTIALIDTSAPVAGEYAPEFTVECTEGFEFDEIEFTDDCFGLDISFTDITQESECESTYDITRIWTATDICGNSVQAVQVVHVVDTKAPETNLENVEITVTCDNVPEIPVAVPFGECGPTETEFTEQVEYLEQLESNCELGNAQSLSGDVAIWLPSLSGSGSDFVFGPETGTFTRDHGTGNVLITGQVYNVNNPAESWILDFILEDEMNWAQWSAEGGSYKDDLGQVGDNYLDWSYFKLSSNSKLIGADAYEGSELNLTHTPLDFEFGFQLGIGANNRNMSYGISGWFFYEGVLDGDFVYGTGDLIADMKCCPDYDITRIWDFSDCSGNNTIITHIIHVREQLALADLDNGVQTDAQFDVSNSSGTEFVINFDSGDDVEKTLTMTDLSGKVVYQNTYDGLEKNTKYTYSISKNAFLDGMYMFYLSGTKSVNSDKEMNMRN